MPRKTALLAAVAVLAGCGGTGHTPAPGDPRPSSTPRPVSGPHTGAIASGDGVSSLSAYGGHLVFNRREGDRYRLFHWHDGRINAL